MCADSPHSSTRIRNRRRCSGSWWPCRRSSGGRRSCARRCGGRTPASSGSSSCASATRPNAPRWCTSWRRRSRCGRLLFLLLLSTLPRHTTHHITIIATITARRAAPGAAAGAHLGGALRGAGLQREPPQAPPRGAGRPPPSAHPPRQPLPPAGRACLARIIAIVLPYVCMYSSHDHHQHNITRQ